MLGGGGGHGLTNHGLRVQESEERQSHMMRRQKYSLYSGPSGIQINKGEGKGNPHEFDKGLKTKMVRQKPD